MSGDLYFSKVALLLAGDTFTDASNNKTAVTASGINISNAFPGVIAKSLWFQDTLTGQPLYATAPANSFIDANEDFSIELTAYCRQNVNGSALYSTRTNSGIASGLLIGLKANGTVFVRATSGGQLVIKIDTQYPVTLNALHTFCIERYNGNWTLYVDGLPVIDLQHTSLFTGAIDHSDKIYIGCDPYTTPFIGAISQVRVTVGVARYRGSYPIALTPYALYSSTPNVVFSNLSTSIATANAAFNATLDITNISSATISAVNGDNTPVGGNWSIIPTTNGNPNGWIISGIAPATVVNFSVVVSVVTLQALGSLTASHVYKITNTTNGTITSNQALVQNSGTLALWLDPSDASSVVSSSGNVVQLIDKNNGIVFSPASGGPVPTVDSAAFTTLNAIGFTNNAACGLIAQTPIQVSDASNDSTIFLVGKYTGQQLGQGAGSFQLSYVPSTNIADGTSKWILSTSNVGTTNAAASFYDSNLVQDAVGTAPTIQPGTKFLVAWKSSTGTAEIYINQRLAATTLISGVANLWSSVDSAIKYIGGAVAPTGSFITLGEVIAYSSALDSSTTNNIESYLNRKWGIYADIPYSTIPSVLTGYVADQYVATTVIPWATSVSISASAGTGWSIVPTSGGVANLYTISGTLPTTPQSIVLTITSHNGAIVNIDTYTLQALAEPLMPVIGTPNNLACQAGSIYVSLIYIHSADTVTVNANAGSNWNIAAASHGSYGNYLITGTVPNTIGSLVLTVTAVKTQPDGQVSTTEAPFTIVVTGNQSVLNTPYPLDLTGLLSSNLIIKESQTLTAYNGPLNQLLIPVLAPFFAVGLLVQYYLPNGILGTAIKDVDYVLVFEYEEMSTVCQTPIYGGISFNNPNITGEIFLTYQALGGNFALDKQSIIESLFNYSINGQFVSWDAVTNRPAFFPVDTHKLNIQNDSIGYSSLDVALSNLKIQTTIPVVDSDLNNLNLHIDNVNSNPHGITKADLNLGNVQNFGLATNNQITDPTNVTSYLTPSTAYTAIAAALNNASDALRGKAFLNLGLLPGDDVDATKFLTAQGVVNLITSIQSNAVNSLFNIGVNLAQIPATVTPSPPILPFWWRGVKYTAIIDFVNAVETLVGIAPIPYDINTGTFYFPVGVGIPSLVVTPTYTAGIQIGRSVNQPVSWALLVNN